MASPSVESHAEQMKAITVAIVVAFSSIAVMVAQSASDNVPGSPAAPQQRGLRPLEFQVVSIKPVTGPLRPSGPQTPGRYRNEDATLRTLVAFAYELPFGRIAGGPRWLTEARFSVHAVAPGTPTLSDVRQMMQSLLADRFNLKVHWESREMDVYLLERFHGDAKPWPGLTVSSERDCAALNPASAQGEVQIPCGVISVTTGEMRGRRISMSQLVRNLTAVPMLTGIERVVMDRTSLEGPFDFVVKFRPSDWFMSPQDPHVYPDLTTAFQEQLGLKLRPGHAPVEVLVIDHADSPPGD